MKPIVVSRNDSPMFLTFEKGRISAPFYSSDRNQAAPLSMSDERYRWQHKGKSDSLFRYVGTPQSKLL